MATLLQVIRNRLLPAILTGAGVAIIVTGLLWYGGPVEAGPNPTPEPTTSVVAPTATADASPSAHTSPSPSSAAGRVATRVQVPALRIDLPVIKPPGGPSTYPLCNVAMYLDVPPLGQPGGGRAIYLYAHAREGMFLPILKASQVNDGQKMVGMIVNLYTSDDQLFLYEIVEVRRHQTDLNDAVHATTEQLWLQTSEGPKGTPGKTQVVAKPLSTGPADHALAHPVPKPVVCG
jgi:hypothetical protein